VSIRGLPQNRVELNGRSTIGDSRDGISLQDFPSSFLKTVEVVKSPTADMIEGALGGTVSLRTVRPLELDKLTAAMSLDAEYADKTENVAP
ncbi:TonB-dependent receptor plug domain-containing protein, partial [Pseudoalteromonas sp. GW168-MNA-CIBAN-0100]